MDSASPLGLLPNGLSNQMICVKWVRLLRLSKKHLWLFPDRGGDITRQQMRRRKPTVIRQPVLATTPLLILSVLATLWLSLNLGEFFFFADFGSNGIVDAAAVAFTALGLIGVAILAWKLGETVSHENTRVEDIFLHTRSDVSVRLFASSGRDCCH